MTDEIKTTLADGSVIFGGTQQMHELLLKRGLFSKQYCAERGWNMDKLSFAQMLEIRNQPGWKTPQEVS